jgi:branched-chain amino acid transport system permease protein
MSQILINLTITASLFIILSLSFSIQYNTTKFFNISQAVIISLGAYFTYLFYTVLNLPLFIAILFSILCSMGISVFFEFGIYRYMRSKNLSSFTLLIASLGIYIIFQNLISIFFGENTKSIRTGDVKEGHQILGAYITDIQIITITVCVILFVAFLLLLHNTQLGRQIRAVSNNPDLCNIFGINSDRIIVWTTAIGTSSAAISGILVGLDVGMTPTFGFNLLLYGVVVMIIGGVGSTRGLIAGALLVAIAQHLAAYYIDTKWMDAVAYIILILFLIWKPLGFSGVRLRKVEI